MDRARHNRRRLVAAPLLVAICVLVTAPLAPADVQEQRARLPPPATCSDPVEGTWMSHKYYPEYADWYVFSLRIRRAQGSSSGLTGEIQAHVWSGGPRDAEPPACTGFGSHWTVFMTAQGTIDDGRIHFWGTSWRPETAFCGRAPVSGEYNLDHFSGTIDPAIQEFQSVNNDGGRSVNDPTVFRRVGCFDPPAAPHVKVAPPPFYPRSNSGGCGWW
ncbi:MAG: hypothetical protein HYY06_22110 [Deltaproteobacteria bacterium]|nr:hypothetical protein [Deltaproteobacteria bacterium]